MEGLVCPTCKESLYHEPASQSATSSSRQLPAHLTAAPCLVTRCGHFVHALCLSKVSACPVCQAHVDFAQVNPAHFPSTPVTGAGDAPSTGRVTLQARRRAITSTSAFGSRPSGPPNKVLRTSGATPRINLPFTTIIVHVLGEMGVPVTTYVQPQVLNQVNDRLNMIARILEETPALSINCRLLENRIRALNNRIASGRDLEGLQRWVVTRIVESIVELEEDDIQLGIDAFVAHLERINGWLQDLNQ